MKVAYPKPHVVPECHEVMYASTYHSWKYVNCEYVSRLTENCDMVRQPTLLCPRWVISDFQTGDLHSCLVYIFLISCRNIFNNKEVNKLNIS